MTTARMESLHAEKNAYYETHPEKFKEQRLDRCETSSDAPYILV